MEKAPGPSKMTATTVMTIAKLKTMVSCKPERGTGSQDRPIAKNDRASANPTNGVNKPTAKAPPHAARAKPSDHLPKVGVEEPEK